MGKARQLSSILFLLILLAGALAGCGGPAGPEHFSGDLAYQHLQDQMAIGPRIVGTDGDRQCGDLIIAELRKLGWKVEEQEFVFKGTPIRNIIATRGEGTPILFGAHYDTRRYANQDPDPAKQKEPVPGADDGASGVAVLLELARVLSKTKLEVEVRLAFFDAEDNGDIDGWPFSVGAGYMAQQLQHQDFPAYVIVADMVGDADQQIYQERSSDPGLQASIWSLAAELGYGDVFSPTIRYALIDDHRPFLDRGIRAVDIIDFDYPYWHTVSDTADKVSPQSLERVGRVLEEMVRRKVGLGGK